MNKLQDVDRCVKCGHRATIKGICQVGVTGPLDPYGRNPICGCKCEFPSTSVSEAAPERIWIERPLGEGYPRSTGFYVAPITNGIEYARVHQLPELNLEEKNSGEPKPKAPSHSSVVADKDITLMLAEIRERRAKTTPGPWTTKPGTFWICDVGRNGLGVWSTAYPPEGTPFPFAPQEADAEFLANAPTDIDTLLSIIDSLQTALAEERERCCVAVCFMCQNPQVYGPAMLNVGDTWTHGQTAETGLTVCRATDIRSNPITQAGASASAQSTTVPDHGQAFPPESELPNIEQVFAWLRANNYKLAELSPEPTLVTVDEVSKEQQK